MIVVCCRSVLHTTENTCLIIANIFARNFFCTNTTFPPFFPPIQCLPGLTIAISVIPYFNAFQRTLHPARWLGQFPPTVLPNRQLWQRDRSCCMRSRRQNWRYCVSARVIVVSKCFWTRIKERPPCPSSPDVREAANRAGVAKNHPPSSPDIGEAANRDGVASNHPPSSPDVGEVANRAGAAADDDVWCGGGLINTTIKK